MEYKASLSHVRITPRKVGLMADEVRGKDINEAMMYLQSSPRRRVAGKILGLLKSAVANADVAGKGAVDVDNLYVKTILVGKGPILKRFRPRAKGSAFPVLKRTSHIKVALAEK